MKKIIFIAIIVIVVAIIAFFIFQKNSPNVTSENSTGTPEALLPIATTSPYAPPNTAAVTIGTPEGSVTVNNFYTGAKISVDQTSVLVKDAPDYNITYYVPDSSFNILIEQTPFDDVRKEAEAAFLQTLDISQSDACKLKVKVGAPISVDPDHAGQNLGLSFCASSTFSE
jgi:uncharacterized protein YxeA